MVGSCSHCESQSHDGMWSSGGFYSTLRGSNWARRLFDKSSLLWIQDRAGTLSCYCGFRIEHGSFPATVDSGSSWDALLLLWIQDRAWKLSWYCGFRIVLGRSPASLSEFVLSIYSLQLCSTAPVCVAVYTPSLRLLSSVLYTSSVRNNSSIGVESIDCFRPRAAGLWLVEIGVAALLVEPSSQFRASVCLINTFNWIQ